MGLKITFSPEAVANIERIVRTIARDNPAAAERLGHALLDRVAILQNFPYLGSIVPKRRGIRKLVCPPYIIYYRPRVESGCIDVLRYRHGARSEPTFD
jgi:toxin ParE1/3/4